MKRNNIKYKIIFSILIIFVTSFMSIGYSALSTNLNVTSDVVYNVKKGIYISDLKVNDANGVTTNSYTDNIVTQNFVGSGHINYNVTIRNKTDDIKVIKDVITNNSKVRAYVVTQDGENFEGQKIMPHTTIVIILEVDGASLTSSETIPATLDFENYEKYYLKSNPTSTTEGYFGCKDIPKGMVKSVVMETNKYKPLETHFNQDGQSDSTEYCDVSANGDGSVFIEADKDTDGYYNVAIKSVDNKIYVTGNNKIGYGLNNVKTFSTKNINSDELTSTSSMFQGDSSLKTLDLTDLTTNNVTTMASMFHSCSNLTTLDLSNFNTAKVTNMNRIFYNNVKLANLNISSFNTSKVTNMAYMFYNTNKITSLDLSNFNTANTTNMDSMFAYASSLNMISSQTAGTYNLTNFDTANVTTMKDMFNSNTAAVKIDLSSFNAKKVTDISGIFNSCTSLTRIFSSPLWRGVENYDDYISSGISSNVYDKTVTAFQGDTKLAGGCNNSWTYSTNRQTADQASLYINGTFMQGTGSSGYFTCKNYGTYLCKKKNDTTMDTQCN